MQLCVCVTFVFTNSLHFVLHLSAHIEKYLKFPGTHFDCIKHNGNFLRSCTNCSSQKEICTFMFIGLFFVQY